MSRCRGGPDAHRARVFGLVLVWGFGIELRLIDEDRERAAIPGLPASWEGRTVAFLPEWSYLALLEEDPATTSTSAGA